MQTWRWSETSFTPCDAVPLTDRGFRYGMSVFETVRIWKSRPLFLVEHCLRLRAACTDRRFQADERAFDALAAALSGLPDGVARVYVTAGDGGLTDQTFPEPRIFILAENRPPPVETPCRLAIVEEMQRPAFGGLKTANYWSNVEALQKAVHAGCEEALLFNENSELISAAAANVFLVHGEKIMTPSLACGARDGVTRRWVMDRRPVEERSVFLHDVQRADEIFLTSSWHGVRAVSSLDGTPRLEHRCAERLAIEFSEAIECDS